MGASTSSVCTRVASAFTARARSCRRQAVLSPTQLEVVLWRGRTGRVWHEPAISCILIERGPCGDLICGGTRCSQGRSRVGFTLTGRLASVVAKELLSGQSVVVTRCEEIEVSGNFYRNKLKFM